MSNIETLLGNINVIYRRKKNIEELIKLINPPVEKAKIDVDVGENERDVLDEIKNMPEHTKEIMEELMEYMPNLEVNETNVTPDEYFKYYIEQLQDPKTHESTLAELHAIDLIEYIKDNYKFIIDNTDECIFGAPIKNKENFDDYDVCTYWIIINNMKNKEIKKLMLKFYDDFTYKYQTFNNQTIKDIIDKYKKDLNNINKKYPTIKEQYEDALEIIDFFYNNFGFINYVDHKTNNIDCILTKVNENDLRYHNYNECLDNLYDILTIKEIKELMEKFWINVVSIKDVKSHIDTYKGKMNELIKNISPKPKQTDIDHDIKIAGMLFKKYLEIFG